jgi:hypothetical protein
MGAHFDVVFKLGTILWLALAVAELAVAVPFSQGREGTPAESPARALLILLALSLIFSIVQDLPELGGPSLFTYGSNLGRGVDFLQLGLFTAVEICLWLALMRSLAQPPNWNVAFYTLLSLRAGVWLLHLVMAQDAYLQLVKQPLAGFFLRWGRLAVGVTLQLLPLGLLRRLLAGGAAVSAAPATTAANVKAAPGRDIAVGAAWLGGGLLVTIISYSAAASSTGGGRYVVATGAIAYGLARLVRGFVRLGG